MTKIKWKIPSKEEIIQKWKEAGLIPEDAKVEDYIKFPDTFPLTNINKDKK